MYTHVMLHPPAKFRRDRTNIGGLLMSYRSIKMAVIVGNLLLSSGLVNSFVQNGEKLCAYQIWMKYIDSLLR